MGLTVFSVRTRAHPRSRGENNSDAGIVNVYLGSSPLTRGKRQRPHRSRHVRRLIPAHAGKTRPPVCQVPGWAAHPRSRGENIWTAVASKSLAGSSPLTRGKPRTGLREVAPVRLIPAHAGKTRPRIVLAPGIRAHPRSRGENRVQARRTRLGSGSSPLTRGKLACELVDGGTAGLIPAHAGKT